MAQPPDTTPDPTAGLPAPPAFPADAIARRRAALEDQGFVVVAHDADQLVAVRKRFYWGACVRVSTILRVRRAAAVDRPDLEQALRDLQADAGALDPAKIPRGFCQMRAVMDVVLADTATDAAVAYARSTNRKGMGLTAQVTLARPDGSIEQCGAVWGMAYQPWLAHAGLVGATGQSAPEPGAPMGTGIGLLVMWPSVLSLTLMCCGLPLVFPVIAAVAEKDPAPAPLPSGTPPPDAP